MLDKLRLKFWCVIALFITSGVIFILNILYIKGVQNISNIPFPKINLGLDLVGGVHLAFKPDFNIYIAEKYQKIANDIENLQIASIDNISEYGIQIIHKAINFSEKLKKIDNSLIFNEKTGLISFTQQHLNKINDDIVNQSIEVIRNRVDAVGTKEINLYRSQADLIILQIPNKKDTTDIKQLLSSVAKLNFHLLNPANPFTHNPNLIINSRYKTIPYYSSSQDAKQKLYYVIDKNIAVNGENLSDARISFENISPSVTISFNSKGAKEFAKITAQNTGRQLAIVLDDKVISAPNINEPILSGNAVISGQFTPQEIKYLAISLKSGALPTKFTIVEEKIIDSSLGKDAIYKSAMSMICGFLLILVIMLLCYKKMGILASFGLLLNLFLTISTFAIFGITLTMPGMAGLLLTLAMAVDANVLIYEKMREFDKNKTIKITLIQNGFSGAISAITDSNITTIFATCMLLFFGSVFVKGFAISLIIGIIFSFFTAVSFIKIVAEYFARKSNQNIEKNFV